MIRKTLPLLLALALAGCVTPPAAEAPKAPVVDANGVEVLPTDEVITEDELLS